MVRSTTLTPEGRRMRSRIIWGLGATAALVGLAFAFMALDRSTVVDGPDGSSFATTATGLAALHDTLDRAGKSVTRIQRPLDPTVLSGASDYIVADVGFGQYEAVETSTLRGFVEGGGTAWILGVPPRSLVETFAIDAEWVGSAAGTVPVADSLPNASAVSGSRFGQYQPGHDGEVIAGTDESHLVIRFRRGEGAVLLVADSALGHNSTVSEADNIDLFGDLVGPGPVAFDEYRHGYDDTPSAGIVSAAPGNWEGALVIGGIVVVLMLITYGRRLGPAEPVDRLLAPDRTSYIDALSHRLRRAGRIPTAPLRRIAVHRLHASPDADLAEAARHAGFELEGDPDDPMTLDHLLAAMSRRPR